MRKWCTKQIVIENVIVREPDLNIIIMKSTKSNTSKKYTKKSFKPVYTVDLTNVTNEQEAALRFALSKYNANVSDFVLAQDIYALKAYIRNLSLVLAINEMVKGNRIYILGHGVSYMTEPINSDITDFKVELKTKKPNIFKRFWNWITRKK